MQFYPFKKKGGGGGFSHAEGGGTKSFGVFFVRMLGVLAILKGGWKKFPLFKRGDVKSFSMS